MNELAKAVYYIELHAVEDLRNCFAAGLSPHTIYKGAPLIDELTSEYTRSPRFKDCVKAFVDAGLAMDDKSLLAVLLNDAGLLEKELKKKPDLLTKRRSLRCAYTPLLEVTLLHICAEFNHVDCAEVLLKYGADVNAAAGTDSYGFGGHTPIFHTVNQNGNQSADMRYLLLANNASVTITVPGLVWGKDYPWETFFPAVNPLSYAMMGLLPQMHRDEVTIANTITELLKHTFGIDYKPPNVPNKYLQQ